MFHSALWKATLLGSQQVLALAVSYYIVGGRIKVHHSGSNQNAPLWTAVF
jgi:hypothetical protein